MPEVHCKAFLSSLKKNPKQPCPPVVLIYGEEMLYRAALEALVDHLVPGPSRSLNYVPIRDADVGIFEVIEQINTFSLLSGKKLIALCDSPIFASKQNEGKLLEKTKAAMDENDLPTAARTFASLMGVLNITLKDIQGMNAGDVFDMAGGESNTDDSWLDRIVLYCIENGVTPTPGADDASALQRAIEKGFPPGHHLAITTDTVDKRKNLYKTIKEKGLTIDCAVAKGERKDARVAQEAVLQDQMKAMLADRGKTTTRIVYDKMVEMTGFDLRTFSNNLEKLISYVGERKQITLDDAEAVLSRTRIDPIYQLTGAIFDRNAENALFYLNALISAGYHPLQMLAAIANQARRLLLIKDFVDSRRGAGWQSNLSFPLFTSRVLPRIQEHDQDLLDRLTQWNRSASNDEDAQQGPRGKKKPATGKPNTDLVIARDPKNAYPLFQLIKQSDNFSKAALFKAFESLVEADYLLKSSGRNPKLILENVIFGICRFAEAPKTP